jgi:hypothetical protein
MRTTVLTAALLAVAAAPLAAQQHQHHQHEKREHQHHAEHLPAGEFPDGWNVRVDRDQPADDIMFHAMEDHFHARTGPAAVFYRDDWAHTGNYALSARFRQNRAPQHPEAYGLVIGGRDLAGAGQTYSYFLVRGTGEYFIATRDGAERTIVTGWTRHDAIRPQDADSGVQTNVLGVRVEGNDVVFTVNGTEVESRPRAGLHTDGVAGFRINHRLDVRIDELQR